MPKHMSDCNSRTVKLLIIALQIDLGSLFTWSCQLWGPPSGMFWHWAELTGESITESRQACSQLALHSPTTLNLCSFIHLHRNSFVLWESRFHDKGMPGRIQPSLLHMNMRRALSTLSQIKFKLQVQELENQSHLSLVLFVWWSETSFIEETNIWDKKFTF